MRRICILLLFTIFGICLAGSTPDGGNPPLSVFMEGKEFLDKGRYGEAIEKLKAALGEIPVIADYTLFFLAAASSKLERVEESNAYLDELLKSFPESPLRKKARSLQLRNNLSVCERDGEFIPGDMCEGAEKSLEAYVADYPEDTAMGFRFALILKKKGKTGKATMLLKEIYISNMPYSESALQELRPSDITAEDLLAKASNFIRDTEYKKAESLLRKALLISNSPLKREISEKLGTSLFRQKRYREAAEEFLSADDLYGTARSYYRAGEFEAFHKILVRLLSSEDKRAGTLMIAFSSKKRREGNAEEAIRILTDVKRRFPSLAEDALWGIGWIFYRKGDYGRAFDALTELADAYRSAKYLYWKARALEAAAEGEPGGKKALDANSLYKTVQTFQNDYYGLLARSKKAGSETGTTSSVALNVVGEPVLGNDFCTFKSGPSRECLGSSTPSSPVMKDAARYFNRFDILLAIGMKEEAISELTSLSGRIQDPEIMIYASRRLQEAGAYRKSISLTSILRKRQDLTLSSSFDLNAILYPFAFWEAVRDAAIQYRIDPLILLSVMREESRFDPDARSIAGALGLMQIMPQTASALSGNIPDIPDRPDVHNVKTNITIGAYFLERLLMDFGSLPTALAAYNAGVEKVREWLRYGNYLSEDEFIEDIPFDETKTYVKKVLTTYAVYREQAAKYIAACKTGSSQ